MRTTVFHSTITPPATFGTPGVGLDRALGRRFGGHAEDVWLKRLLLILIVAAGMGPLLRLGPFSVARGLGAIFILAMLPRLLDHVRSIRLLPAVFGFAYTAAWLLGASAIDQRALLLSLVYFGYGLLATQVALIDWQWRNVRIILLLLVALGVFSAFTAVVEYYTHFNFITGKINLGDHGMMRSQGLYDNANSTAGFVAIGLLAWLMLWRESHKRPVLMTVLTFPIVGSCLWGLYTTASRTSMVALILGLLPIVFGRSLWGEKRRRVLVMLTVAFVVIGPIQLMRGREFNFNADYSARQRLWHVPYSMERFYNNPLIGSLAVDKPYFAHNNFFEVLAHGGLVGFVPYILLNGFLIWRIWQRRHDRVLAGIGAVFLAGVGMGLGCNWTNDVIYWMVIGICLGRATAEPVLVVQPTKPSWV